MFSRNRLLAAAFGVGVVAVSLAVQAAGARETKAARTLLTTIKPIRAFAQDIGHIAWVGGKWNVDVRRLGGRRTPKTLRVGSAKPFSALASEAPPPQLALAGSRVVWTRSGGGNELETDVLVRGAGSRHRPQLLGSDAGDNEEGGGFFGALAGAGSTAVYSFVEYHCVFDAEGGCPELALNSFVPGTFSVRGSSGSERLSAVPTAANLAVSGRRVAVLPPADSILPFPDIASPPLAAAGMTVDVYDTKLPIRLGQFMPPGTVRALALSGTLGAVVDEAADGTRTIERYYTATGALIGSTTVAAGDQLAAGGNTLVYAVGNQIEAMDATTGAQQVLATSPGPPIGLSVVGKRVAWAVNVHGHGRILAVTLP
jgi:hypothetical protein